MKHRVRKMAALILSLVILLSALPLTVSAEEGCEDEEIVYHVRPVVNADGVTIISAEKYHAAESEHFQLLWGDQNNSYINDAWIKNIFDMYEACWKLYIDDLGMTPPSLCTFRNGDHKTHYKVNVVVWGTGLPGYHNAADPNEWAAYGGVDYEGYGYMMCSRSAMESNSWALPHEFGHVTHFAQGYNSWSSGNYLGPWYEAIGNWFREQYLYSDYYTAGGTRTDFSHLILRAASLTAANGRAYYEAWPILQYLTENPDGLEGYGSDFVAKLLQNGSASGYIYTMIAEHAKAPLEDMLGYFAAHMATLDFEHQDSYIANVQSSINYQDFFWQQFYTMLEAVPYSENTYAVPTERAPQQAAYVVAPLTASGDEITVTLHGLSALEGAAWRACVVTVKGGVSNYSELFGDGESVTVNVSGASEIYLTVAATPALDKYVKYAAFQSENEVPFSQKPRYPFEAVIVGAEPSRREIKASSAGEDHINGGGFVAKSAKVDEGVYVGPDAMVLGNAVVTGNARIEGHAVVMGNAKVSGDAVIDGFAVVAGNAAVGHEAHVGDSAVVTGSAMVSGNANVIESAYVAGNYKLSDNATAKGLALCLGQGALTGTAVADGDFFEDGGLSIKDGTAFGYFPSLGDQNAQKTYVDGLKKSKGLYIGYDFSKTQDTVIAAPQSGSTYAVVHGAAWDKGSAETALGFYTFGGSDQFIMLDGGTILPRDVQIAMNVRPDADSGNILYYEGENGSMSLIPADGDGMLKFELKVGDKTVTLRSKTALTKGEWAEVVVTFVDGLAVLTIGEETHDAVETSLVPADIKATAGAVGGGDGDGFRGAVDYVKFYVANKLEVPTSVTVKNEPVETESPTGTESGDANEGGCGSVVCGSGIMAALVLAAAVMLKKKR